MLKTSVSWGLVVALIISPLPVFALPSSSALRPERAGSEEIAAKLNPATAGAEEPAKGKPKNFGEQHERMVKEAERLAFGKHEIKPVDGKKGIRTEANGFFVDAVWTIWLALYSILKEVKQHPQSREILAGLAGDDQQKLKSYYLAHYNSLQPGSAREIPEAVVKKKIASPQVKWRDLFGNPIANANDWLGKHPIAFAVETGDTILLFEKLELLLDKALLKPDQMDENLYLLMQGGKIVESMSAEAVVGGKKNPADHYKSGKIRVQSKSSGTPPALPAAKEESSVSAQTNPYQYLLNPPVRGDDPLPVFRHRLATHPDRSKWPLELVAQGLAGGLRKPVEEILHRLELVKNISPDSPFAGPEDPLAWAKEVRALLGKDQHQRQIRDAKTSKEAALKLLPFLDPNGSDLALVIGKIIELIQKEKGQKGDDQKIASELWTLFGARSHALETILLAGKPVDWRIPRLRLRWRDFLKDAKVKETAIALLQAQGHGTPKQLAGWLDRGNLVPAHFAFVTERDADGVKEFILPALKEKAQTRLDGQQAEIAMELLPLLDPGLDPASGMGKTWLGILEQAAQYILQGKEESGLADLLWKAAPEALTEEAVTGLQTGGLLYSREAEAYRFIRFAAVQGEEVVVIHKIVDGQEDLTDYQIERARLVPKGWRYDPPLKPTAAGTEEGEITRRLAGISLPQQKEDLLKALSIYEGVTKEGQGHIRAAVEVLSKRDPDPLWIEWGWKTLRAVLEGEIGYLTQISIRSMVGKETQGQLKSHLGMVFPTEDSGKDQDVLTPIAGQVKEVWGSLDGRNLRSAFEPLAIKLPPKPELKTGKQKNASPVAAAKQPTTRAEPSKSALPKPAGLSGAMVLEVAARLQKHMSDTRNQNRATWNRLYSALADLNFDDKPVTGSFSVERMVVWLSGAEVLGHERDKSLADIEAVSWRIYYAPQIIRKVLDARLKKDGEPLSENDLAKIGRRFHADERPPEWQMAAFIRRTSDLIGPVSARAARVSAPKPPQSPLPKPLPPASKPKPQPPAPSLPVPAPKPPQGVTGEMPEEIAGQLYRYLYGPETTAEKLKRHDQLSWTKLHDSLGPLKMRFSIDQLSRWLQGQLIPPDEWSQPIAVDVKQALRPRIRLAAGVIEELRNKRKSSVEGFLDAKTLREVAELFRQDDGSESSEMSAFIRRTAVLMGLAAAGAEDSGWGPGPDFSLHPLVNGPPDHTHEGVVYRFNEANDHLWITLQEHLGDRVKLGFDVRDPEERRVPGENAIVLRSRLLGKLLGQAMKRKLLDENLFNRRIRLRKADRLQLFLRNPETIEMLSSPWLKEELAQIKANIVKNREEKGEGSFGLTDKLREGDWFILFDTRGEDRTKWKPVAQGTVDSVEEGQAHLSFWSSRAPDRPWIDRGSAYEERLLQSAPENRRPVSATRTRFRRLAVLISPSKTEYLIQKVDPNNRGRVFITTGWVDRRDLAREGWQWRLTPASKRESAVHRLNELGLEFLDTMTREGQPEGWEIREGEQTISPEQALDLLEDQPDRLLLPAADSQNLFRVVSLEEAHTLPVLEELWTQLRARLTVLRNEGKHARASRSLPANWGGGPLLRLSLEASPERPTPDRQAVVYGFNEAVDRLWISLLEFEPDAGKKVRLSFIVRGPDGARVPSEKVVVWPASVLNAVLSDGVEANAFGASMVNRVWVTQGRRRLDFKNLETIQLLESDWVKGRLSADKKRIAENRDQLGEGERGKILALRKWESFVLFDTSGEDPKTWRPIAEAEVDSMPQDGVFLQFSVRREEPRIGVDRESIYRQRPEGASPETSAGAEEKLKPEEVHILILTSEPKDHGQIFNSVRSLAEKAGISAAQIHRVHAVRWAHQVIEKYKPQIGFLEMSIGDPEVTGIDVARWSRKEGDPSARMILVGPLTEDQIQERDLELKPGKVLSGFVETPGSDQISELFRRFLDERVKPAGTGSQEPEEGAPAVLPFVSPELRARADLLQELADRLENKLSPDVSWRSLHKSLGSDLKEALTLERMILLFNQGNEENPKQKLSQEQRQSMGWDLTYTVSVIDALLKAAKEAPFSEAALEKLIASFPEVGDQHPPEIRGRRVRSFARQAAAFLGLTAAGAEAAPFPTGFELQAVPDQQRIESNRAYLEAKGWFQSLSGLAYDRPFILEDPHFQKTLEILVQVQQARQEAGGSLRALAAQLSQIAEAGAGAIFEEVAARSEKLIAPTTEEDARSNVVALAHLLQSLHFFAERRETEALAAYDSARQALGDKPGFMADFFSGSLSDDLYLLGRFYMDHLGDMNRARFSFEQGAALYGRDETAQFGAEEFAKKLGAIDLLTNPKKSGVQIVGSQLGIIHGASSRAIQGMSSGGDESAQGLRAHFAQIKQKTLDASRLVNQEGIGVVLGAGRFVVFPLADLLRERLSDGSFKYKKFLLVELGEDISGRELKRMADAGEITPDELARVEIVPSDATGILKAVTASIDHMMATAFQASPSRVPLDKLKTLYETLADPEGIKQFAEADKTLVPEGTVNFAVFAMAIQDFASPIKKYIDTWLELFPVNREARKEIERWDEYSGRIQKNITGVILRRLWKEAAPGGVVFLGDTMGLLAGKDKEQRRIPFYDTDSLESLVPADLPFEKTEHASWLRPNNMGRPDLFFVVESLALKKTTAGAEEEYGHDPELALGLLREYAQDKGSKRADAVTFLPGGKRVEFKLDPFDEKEVLRRLKEVAWASVSGAVVIRRVGPARREIEIRPYTAWFEKPGRDTHRRILEIRRSKAPETFEKLVAIMLNPEVLFESRVAAARAAAEIDLKELSDIEKALAAVQGLSRRNETDFSGPQTAFYLGGMGSVRRTRMHRQLARVAKQLSEFRARAISELPLLPLEEIYRRIQNRVRRESAQVFALDLDRLLRSEGGMVSEKTIELLDRLISRNPVARVVLVTSEGSYVPQLEVINRLQEFHRREVSVVTAPEGSGRSRWAALREWAKEQRVPARQILFMAGELQERVSFPELSDWKDSVIYLGRSRPDLPDGMIPIARDGEWGPPNWEEVVRAVVALEMAKQELTPFTLSTITDPVVLVRTARLDQFVAADPEKVQVIVEKRQTVDPQLWEGLPIQKKTIVLYGALGRLGERFLRDGLKELQQAAPQFEVDVIAVDLWDPDDPTQQRLIQERMAAIGLPFIAYFPLKRFQEMVREDGTVLVEGRPVKVDGVIPAVYTRDHLSLAEPWIKRGVPVWMDKPIVRIEEVDRLRQLARQYPGKVMGVDFFMYSDALLWLLSNHRAEKLIREIGPIRRIDGRCCEPWGLEGENRGWLMDPELSGGTGLDIDTVVHPLAELEPLVQLIGRVWGKNLSLKDAQVTGVVRGRYKAAPGAGETYVWMEGSVGGIPLYVDGGKGVDTYYYGVTVTGTEGSVEVFVGTGEHDPYVKMTRADGRVELHTFPRGSLGYRNIWLDFLLMLHGSDRAVGGDLATRLDAMTGAVDLVGKAERFAEREGIAPVEHPKGKTPEVPIGVLGQVFAGMPKKAVSTDLFQRTAPAAGAEEKDRLLLLERLNWLSTMYLTKKRDSPLPAIHMEDLEGVLDRGDALRQLGTVKGLFFTGLSPDRLSLGQGADWGVEGLAAHRSLLQVAVDPNLPEPADPGWRILSSARALDQIHLLADQGGESRTIPYVEFDPSLQAPKIARRIEDPREAENLEAVRQRKFLGALSSSGGFFLLGGHDLKGLSASLWYRELEKRADSDRAAAGAEQKLMDYLRALDIVEKASTPVMAGYRFGGSLIGGSASQGDWDRLGQARWQFALALKGAGFDAPVKVKDEFLRLVKERQIFPTPQEEEWIWGAAVGAFNPAAGAEEEIPPSVEGETVEQYLTRLLRHFTPIASRESTQVVSFLFFVGGKTVEYGISVEKPGEIPVELARLFDRLREQKEPVRPEDPARRLQPSSTQFISALLLHESNKRQVVFDVALEQAAGAEEWSELAPVTLQPAPGLQDRVVLRDAEGNETAVYLLEPANASQVIVGAQVLNVEGEPAPMNKEMIVLGMAQLREMMVLAFGKDEADGLWPAAARDMADPKVQVALVSERFLHQMKVLKQRLHHQSANSSLRFTGLVKLPLRPHGDKTILFFSMSGDDQNRWRPIALATADFGPGPGATLRVRISQGTVIQDRASYEMDKWKTPGTWNEKPVRGDIWELEDAFQMIRGYINSSSPPFGKPPKLRFISGIYREDRQKLSGAELQKDNLVYRLTKKVRDHSPDGRLLIWDGDESEPFLHIGPAVGPNERIPIARASEIIAAVAGPGYIQKVHFSETAQQKAVSISAMQKQAIKENLQRLGGSFGQVLLLRRRKFADTIFVHPIDPLTFAAGAEEEGVGYVAVEGLVAAVPARARRSTYGVTVGPAQTEAALRLGALPPGRFIVVSVGAEEDRAIAELGVPPGQIVRDKTTAIELAGGFLQMAEGFQVVRVLDATARTLAELRLWFQGLPAAWQGGMTAGVEEQVLQLEEMSRVGV